MKKHKVHVYKSKESLKQTNELAYKLALIAKNKTPLKKEVKSMIINRIIDNASVAIGAINHKAVCSARAQALSHPKKNGATIFGMPSRLKFSPEWASWANNTAVRELDYHDTFLAADYSHPADNIPPLIAVAQCKNIETKRLLQAIAISYEVHVALVKSICLHKYKKDHIAHLSPAMVCGLGHLLNLKTKVIYEAINQAVHLSFSTRQSRKGNISSWKAYAPAFAGKLSIEAVDRAMRGETSPNPIYEGEDSVIAYMLCGPKESYEISLPEEKESKEAILETYTKEHSAEYQAQALIDLAFSFHDDIDDLESIKSITIHTSHHTHYVIGTGSGDVQKFSPQASRETLDHSMMYIFAVALEDRNWHHVKSYGKKRAHKPSTLRLWKKIKTKESAKWTKLYHHPNPAKKAFGALVEVRLKNGTVLKKEKLLANAHPHGDRPFQTENYIEKFKKLTTNIITEKESERFLKSCLCLKNSKSSCHDLNIEVPFSKLKNNKRNNEGLF